MRINLPRLLNGSMGVKNRLHPSKETIKRNLYSMHTASMTLPPDGPVVKERDWIALYDRYGSAGVFRVSRIRTAYGQQNELHLKHGFCVLEDDTVKVTDGKICGTAEAIIRHLFRCPGVDQAPKYWTFGAFAQTPVIDYEYSNARLSDAVWEVLRKVPGYAFTFDQSSFPWVLGMVKLIDADACEGRFGRNLDSCVVEIDDSSLCTRAYLDDRDGYTDADTVSVWGLVSTTLTVPEDAEQADVDAYVAAYLNEHKNPRISITLNTADMSDATGETLDCFRLGSVCRACLPEYQATVRERIVSLVLPDVYGDPDRVEIAMANRVETASDLLAKLNKNTSALHSASTVTNRRVGGVSKKVEETDIELIRQKEELTDTRYRMAQAGIVIDKDAEFVKAFAYQEQADLLDQRVTATESEILVQADQISMRVQKGEVISSINQTAEEIKIQASKINLSGYVTMSEFEAEIANLENLFAGNATIGGLNVAGTLRTTDMDIASNLTLFGYDTQWKSKTVQTSIPSFTKATVTLANGNSISVVTGWADAPSNHRSTLYYLGQA